MIKNNDENLIYKIKNKENIDDSSIVYFSKDNYRSFDTKTGLYKWFTQTILNLGHGSDFADVRFVSWTVYFLEEFLLRFMFYLLKLPYRFRSVVHV